MKARVLQILWHDKGPIFSVDFEPNSAAGPGPRLATAGADSNVRIWRLKQDAEGCPEIEFLSSLNRHTSAVNCVRWSPKGGILASTGDDGMVILWQQSESQHTNSGSSSFVEDENFNKETWKTIGTLRGTGSEFYDLAWSPDGDYLIVASIDNTARIYDIKTLKCIHVLADHTHYVQGVAWDPLQKYIATQSCDRTVNLYTYDTPKPGSLTTRNVAKHSKIDTSKQSAIQQLSSAAATSATATTKTGLPRTSSFSSSTSSITTTTTSADNNTAAAAANFNSSSSSSKPTQHSGLPIIVKTAPLPPPVVKSDSMMDTSTASTPAASQSSRALSPSASSIFSSDELMQPPPPSPRRSILISRPASPRISSVPPTSLFTSSPATSSSATLTGVAASGSASSNTASIAADFMTAAASSLSTRDPSTPSVPTATSTSTGSSNNNKSIRMYHDEDLTTFFRRLTFTPDGALLLTPAGQYKGTSLDVSGDGSTTVGNEVVKNTVYVYARGKIAGEPVAYLPGHKKPSIAVRCSPIAYQLRPNVRVAGHSTAATTISPQTTATLATTPSTTASSSPTSNRVNGGSSSTTAVAAAAMDTSVDPSVFVSTSSPNSKPQQQPQASTTTTYSNSLFNLPHRIVYAVATQDSVLVYDTQQTSPLVLLSNMHYATFSDLSWSPDGSTLILASTDGYCSVVSFDANELGTPMPDDHIPTFLKQIKESGKGGNSRFVTPPQTPGSGGIPAIDLNSSNPLSKKPILAAATLNLVPPTSQKRELDAGGAVDGAGVSTSVVSTAPAVASVSTDPLPAGSAAEGDETEVGGAVKKRRIAPTFIRPLDK